MTDLRSLARAPAVLLVLLSGCAMEGVPPDALAWAPLDLAGQDWARDAGPPHVGIDIAKPPQDRPPVPQSPVDIQFDDDSEVARERRLAESRSRGGYLYAGGSYARADLDDSAADLQDELNRVPGRNATVEIDDADEGFKVYVGYRFESPFAVELGYTGLEGAASSISANSDPSLVADIRDLHAVSGRGPNLSLLGIPYDDGRWSLFGKIGAWYWESEVDMNLNGTDVRQDRDGWDVLLGAGVQCYLAGNVSLRGEIERYLIDDGSVDVLSLGLNVRF